VAFLNTLDGSNGQPPPNVKRDFVRWPFRRLAIELGITHPGGRDVHTVKVASRNLSNGGICVLHNNYVHPGSGCTIALPHPTRGVVKVSGKVMRCMHRSGVVHEIGIAFEKPIGANEFIVHDPLSNNFSLERVKPVDLKGRALLIEPSKPDRDAISHFLKGTSLAMVCVSNLAEALANCDRFDLVMLSSQIADEQPTPAVAKLRQTGLASPIVMLVPDDSARTREAVRDADVDQFVVRPLTGEMLLRALGDVMLVGRTRMRAGQNVGAAAAANPHAA
jgi:CheY-like chemotaxis protein